MPKERTPDIKIRKENAPLGKPSPSGEHIYEYVDANGKERKVNMYEKTQSYFGITDYKSMIENGLPVEGLEKGDALSENIRDFTGVQGDAVDIIKLSRAISGLSENQIAYILQQNDARIQNTSETGQGTTKEPNDTTKEQTSSGSTD